MTSHVTDQLTKLLKANTAAPFLFIGSGFSRRYIGLENWEELLSRFCEKIKNFGFYSSQNNRDMPKTASDMAKDFNPVWWESDEFSESRKNHQGEMHHVSSALKFEISNYLTGISSNKPTDEKYVKELEVLSRINVDGIITTNWDLFLEELFPDYQVYIGQEELLFSNPQSIAEIYKIHGCSSRPNSLVLTSEDYEAFEAKNPYLAAKLITLFIEHPIILSATQ
ncbi:SIR2 family protein [Pseudomonas fluorescens]|nr:SIR2 family protein [Pseudomonas fluorescens]